MSRSRSVAAPKRRARPARGRRSNSPIRVTPMARKVCSRATSQAVHAIGRLANCPGNMPRSSMCGGAPPGAVPRANQSAAKVVGAVALWTGSWSRRQQASIAACKRTTGPNSCKLPLISSSRALGGSILTNEVNRCACRQRRRIPASPCSSANCGNIAAYHSCFERVQPAVCGVGGSAPAFQGVTGARSGAGGVSFANRSAVCDAALDFKDHRTGYLDPPDRVGRLAP